MKKDNEEKSNHENAIKAVQQSKEAIAFVSDQMKADKEVALASVKQNWYAIKHISDKMKADKDIALAAVQKDVRAIEYVPTDMKEYKDIALAAVQEHWYAIQYISPDMQAYKDIALAAVRQNGYAIRHVYPGMDEDKEVVLEAVQQNGKAIKYVSPGMKADKDIALAAVQQNGKAIKYVSPGMKEDKDVVLAAVQQNGKAIEYVFGEIKDKAWIKLFTEEDSYIKEFAQKSPCTTIALSDEKTLKGEETSTSGYNFDKNFVGRENHLFVEENSHLKISICYYPNTIASSQGSELVKFIGQKNVFGHEMLAFMGIVDILRIGKLCKDTNIELIYYSDNYGKTAFVKNNEHKLKGYYKFVDVSESSQEKDGEIISTDMQLHVSYPDLYQQQTYNSATDQQELLGDTIN